MYESLKNCFLFYERNKLYQNLFHNSEKKYLKLFTDYANKNIPDVFKKYI